MHKLRKAENNNQVEYKGVNALIKTKIIVPIESWMTEIVRKWNFYQKKTATLV